jgi:hypothetical protein
MKFDFKNSSSLVDTTLDFQGKSINQFVING